MDIIAVLGASATISLCLSSYHDLYIIALVCPRLVSKSGIFVNGGNLFVATVFKLLLQDLLLGLFDLQPFKLLLQLLIVFNPAAFAAALSSAASCSVSAC